MKTVLGITITWLPLIALILLVVKLEELGCATPPSKGGNDIWPLFVALFGGFGLSFLFSFGRREGGFLDIWLDKILERLKILFYKIFIKVKSKLLLKTFVSNKNIIKLLIITASLLCLTDMPYWYYQLFSIYGMIGLAYLAIREYQLGIKFTPQIFIAFAILINPIIKIDFDRDAWQIVDIIIVVILFLSFFLKFTNKKINSS